MDESTSLDDNKLRVFAMEQLINKKSTIKIDIFSGKQYNETSLAKSGKGMSNQPKMNSQKAEKGAQ